MITTVVNAINAAIDNVSIDNQEILGIARIIDEETDKYPAIWNSDERSWYRVILDQSFGITAYHRVLSINEAVLDEFDFRGSIENEHTDVIEMVLVLCLNHQYDYDTAITIKNLIPKKITSTDYDAIYVSTGEVQVNEDEIIEDEFGDTELRRYKADFNLFKINYTVELINC